MRVIIVEDNAQNMQQASSVLRKLGLKDVHAFASVAFAMEHLRQVTEGKKKLPDCLILDLEFSQESGFEVLRYWKSTPTLRSMHVIVWTIMGELEQRMSRMFGVDEVIDKRLGIGELEKSLRGFVGGQRVAKNSSAK